MVLLLARMVGGDEVLAAVLDPFDRPPQAQCCRTHQDVLGIKLAADAEAAADVTFVELNGGCGPSEHAGNLVPVPMRHLGRAVEFEYIADRVVAGNRTAGFQRNAGMPADRQRRADNGVSGTECRSDVAIAFVDDRGLCRPSRFELAGRVGGMQNCRQFFDVQPDELGRILGEIGIVGEHGSNRFADVAHAVGREQPLAIGFETLDPAQAKLDRRNVGNVGGGPDGVDPHFR